MVDSESDDTEQLFHGLDPLLAATKKLTKESDQLRNSYHRHNKPPARYPSRNASKGAIRHQGCSLKNTTSDILSDRSVSSTRTTTPLSSARNYKGSMTTGISLLTRSNSHPEGLNQTFRSHGSTRCHDRTPARKGYNNGYDNADVIDDDSEIDSSRVAISQTRDVFSRPSSAQDSSSKRLHMSSSSSADNQLTSFRSNSRFGSSSVHGISSKFVHNSAIHQQRRGRPSSVVSDSEFSRKRTSEMDRGNQIIERAQRNLLNLLETSEPREHSHISDQPFASSSHSELHRAELDDANKERLAGDQSGMRSHSVARTESEIALKTALESLNREVERERVRATTAESHLEETRTALREVEAELAVQRESAAAKDAMLSQLEGSVSRVAANLRRREQEVDTSTAHLRKQLYRKEAELEDALLAVQQAEETLKVEQSRHKQLLTQMSQELDKERSERACLTQSVASKRYSSDQLREKLAQLERQLHQSESARRTAQAALDDYQSQYRGQSSQWETRCLDAEEEKRMLIGRLEKQEALIGSLRQAVTRSEETARQREMEADEVRRVGNAVVAESRRQEMECGEERRRMVEELEAKYEAKLSSKVSILEQEHQASKHRQEETHRQTLSDLASRQLTELKRLRDAVETEIADRTREMEEELSAARRVAEDARDEAERWRGEFEASETRRGEIVEELQALMQDRCSQAIEIIKTFEQMKT